MNARLSTLLALAALSACSTTTPVARVDSFPIGRNGSGENCLAARNWNDPGVPDAFARAYALTCSGVSANRPLGTLRVVPQSPEALAAIDKQFDCGTAQSANVDAGDATVRRCLDHVTALESVRIDTERGGTHYVAAGAPAMLPQLEEAIAIAAGRRTPSGDVTHVPKATIDIATVPERPGATATSPEAADAASLNISAALVRGIDLNHKGLNVEASRVLNDALSRLPGDALPAVAAELQLEAGLADSNILFPDAAKAHFAAADQLFASAPAARTPFLQRKRDTYLALDALNRRAYDEALTLIDRVGPAEASTTEPLQDPETLRRLNQPGRDAGAAAAALAVPDAAQLSQSMLDAQAQYARSVAYLSLGDAPRASAAIDQAAALYRPLANQRLDQSQLLWLGARINRQRGRIQAQRGDYRGALASYNLAIDMLRRGSIANAGTGSEPAVAEAELERAALYARTGASRADARRTFAAAIDNLIASGATSMGSAVGMEDYLDLLVAEARSGPQTDTYERFFRAMQASGEPAVARQLTQLRAVVTADPKLAVAVRERANLEREITRLRYAITDGGNAGAKGASLEAARGAAERQLIAVDAQLAADSRYRQVDESPVTLAELRQSLRPGEAFVKLTALDRRIYGIVVTADRTFIYHVATSAASKKTVDTLSDQLRASIDGDLGRGKLVPFDEARAYTLFRLISGPAAQALASARAIVVDPAGPLQRLPIGVLVTRYDPKATRTDPFDFSQTAFLANSASISTALSPRSFLIARALPPSRAAKPFLGLGEHQQPALAAGADAARIVPVGYGCTVDYGRLAALSRTLKPIDRRELDIAASALGAGSATMVTDGAFSDTSVEARTDLDQYEVLHFATHGLEEGVWGCPKSPPGLVTSFGGPQSDGLLSFSEIAGLRLDANLVVLSACDTAAGVRDQALARASGQEETGATLEGLVRAFLTANARAVLATYWQVSADKESDEFIRTFYSKARSGTIGDALQAAQRELIVQPAYSHPFYWAPYFLVGDSNKTMLSPNSGQVALR